MVVAKGFKKTELGNIPEDWSVLTLSDKIKVFRGGSPRPIQSYLTENSNGINWIKIGDTSPLSKYIVKSEEKIIPEGENRSRKVFPGDFILSNSMSYGRPYILKIEGCIHDGWLVLKEYQNTFNTEYLYYLLSSSIITNQYKSKASGSSVLNLNKELVKSIFLLIPSNFSEQDSITSDLIDVDDLINCTEALIIKKKNIKQGAMQQLLKPKREWVESKLTDVLDYIHGKAHEQDIVEVGKFIVVNSKFVSTEGAVTKYSNSNYCPARKNDLLMVLSDLPNGKALAKCFFVEEDNKFAVNQRVCIWRSKGTDQRFLFYVLNRNKYFLALNDGVSQTHILNHHIEKCKIFLPIKIEEQIEIATILTDMDNEIISLEKKLAKAILIKQGMIQNLLTGKIRLV